MKSSSYPIPKAAARHTDLSGLGRWLPPRLLPYAQALRLDRPAGYWLLVLPAWFAILMGSQGLDRQTVGLLILFLGGAVAMRGAGCVINDLWDRELDRRVSRTADRPLASGAISGRRALALIVGLTFLGLLVLMFLPWRVWGWSLASLPLIALYPLAKRYIPTPQVVLGLTFAWGALLGWLAVRPELGWAPLCLYLGTFCWILYYDTIYACQDREDDRRLRLYSMPLFLGTYMRPALLGFAMAACLFWVLALIFGGTGFLAWLGLLVFALRLIKQWLDFDPDDAVLCLNQFRANVTYGQHWCLFLVLDLLLF